MAWLLVSAALVAVGLSGEQASCADKKGTHPSLCATESISTARGVDNLESPHAGSFKATVTQLCPTNEPPPLRSFVPAEPRGPGEDDTQAVMYNINLRLEVLLRGDVSTDAGARMQRSGIVQGLNITRISAAQHFGSESLHRLLDERRRDPALVLLFVDEGCVSLELLFFAVHAIFCRHVLPTSRLG